jgi:hypothetical protein
MILRRHPNNQRRHPDKHAVILSKAKDLCISSKVAHNLARNKKAQPEGYAA